MSGAPMRVLPAREAPCRHACPVDQNAKEYVALIAEGRFGDALAVIRRTNPFPSICGRVCSHPCESECRRAGSGGAVAVRWLKRFVADREYEMGTAQTVVAPIRSTRQSVAVVGGGPAGLTAALDLARLGYPVTVFEARAETGGLMRWGIPAFRLPREVVERETRLVEQAGVTIRTGTRLGEDMGLDDLFARGHEAVLLATGCWQQASLGLDGEDGQEGVTPALALLEASETAGFSLSGEHVVVVGATRQGFDVASLAARSGASSVKLLTFLDEGRLPVDPEVLERTREDGVDVLGSVRVVSLDAGGGRLRAIRIEGGGKNRGRSIRATLLLPAVDRAVEPRTLAALGGVRTTITGTILADPHSTMTDRHGVFAAGDAASGPKTVIEAIAAGHRAARGIHFHLCGENWRASGVARSFVPAPQAWELDAPSFSPSPSDRRTPLDGPADALREARRCLRCGTCTDCETCHPDCPTVVAMLVGKKPAGSAHLKLDRDMASSALGTGQVLVDGEPVRAVATVPHVEADLCLGCGSCVDACPYDVIRLAMAQDGLGLAVLDERACRSCGCCVASCPAGAIDQPVFGTRSLGEAARSRAGDVELACRWAGVLDTGAILVPCAGRVGVDLFVEALASGARKVTVTGCGDRCRYRGGDDLAADVVRRVKALAGVAGIDPGRIQLHSDGPAGVGDIPFVPDPGMTAPGTDGRPYGRTLALLQSMLGHPEVVPATHHARSEGEVALLVGCAPYLDALFGSDLRLSPGSVTRSALALIERAVGPVALLEDERACGHFCLPGVSSDMRDRMDRMLLESVTRSGARRVVTTCGIASRALARGPLARAGIEVSHLATELSRHADVPLASRRMKVAILDDPADPQLRAAIRDLVRTAGHSVVAWKPPRKGPGLVRAGVVAVLGRARDAGAEVIVCSSVFASMDLLLARRPGAWDGFGVEVTDVGSLLAGSLLAGSLLAGGVPS